MNPTAFITYSWDDQEHKEWVKSLATKLRSDGIDVKLDVWEAIPGDQLPKFMERSIRENDFVLIVCTPNYKVKSDNRTGGVGYEGDIMTGEAFVDGQIRKFIPILKIRHSHRNLYQVGLKENTINDFRNDDSFDNSYYDLISTIHGEREIAPKIGKKPSFDNLIPKVDANLLIIEDQLCIQIISLNGVSVNFKYYVSNEEGTSLVSKVLMSPAKFRPTKAGSRGKLKYGKLSDLKNIPSDSDSKVLLNIKYESLNYNETLSNNQKGEFTKEFTLNIKARRIK